MFGRVVQFCQQDLWEADLQALNGFQRFCFAFLRLAFVAAWEFKESVLSIRATSLVYTTLLSLVPFLAVTFSVLKAFRDSSTDRTGVSSRVGTPWREGD